MPRVPLFLLALVTASIAGGCGENFQNRLGTHLAGKPFSIGKASRYRTPGVYQGFRETQGVWVVSFDGMVVALSAACPHDGHGTYFDDMSQQFKCAHCAARFDSNGLPRAPRDAEAALARFRIEPVDRQAAPADVELKVNARFQFRQEKNEWSNRFSLYAFDGG